MEKRLKKFLENGTFTNVSEERSKYMSAIKGKHNRSTELTLRMALIRAGINGWKMHYKLPGKPDFYFPQFKIAIFVDGCYWHGCPKCGHIPKTRSEYWKAKISRNIQRDKKNKKLLQNEGITVIRLWEHELKKNLLNKSTSKILKILLQAQRNE